jgi:23S rRNA G2445 N2-methylase RlmL
MLFEKASYQAQEKIMTSKQHTIIGTDSDPEMIRIAQENAKKA